MLFERDNYSNQLINITPPEMPPNRWTDRLISNTHMHYTAYDRIVAAPISTSSARSATIVRRSLADTNTISPRSRKLCDSRVIVVSRDRSARFASSCTYDTRGRRRRRRCGRRRRHRRQPTKSKVNHTQCGERCRACTPWDGWPPCMSLHV